MAERDVNSPVNTRNTTSKLSGNIPGFSPGAKSDPSRGDQATSREPEPPLHEHVVQGADQPAELKTTEPAEPTRVCARVAHVPDVWTTGSDPPYTPPGEPTGGESGHRTTAAETGAWQTGNRLRSE
jgi:hypothetical protein